MDDSCLPPVVNRELLVDAMGSWPSFHDANVLSAFRDGDCCEAVIHVFRMTNSVDKQGYFVLKNHHRVTLLMTGVSECSLPDDYSGDCLFELLFQRVRGNLVITFSSVTDQDWLVTCVEARLSSVVSCDPNGDPAT